MWGNHVGQYEETTQRKKEGEDPHEAMWEGTPFEQDEKTLPEQGRKQSHRTM